MRAPAPLSGLLLLLALAATPLAAPPAFARPAEIAAAIDAPERRGATKVRMFGIDFYSAELWTPGGRPLSWSAPFGLALIYDRSFSAGLLAWASLQEMRRIHGAVDDPEGFEAELRACFRDVVRGDRITGIGNGPDEVRFFHNGVQTCTLTRPDVTRLFFSIWFDPASRDPDGARDLLG